MPELKRINREANLEAQLTQPSSFMYDNDGDIARKLMWSEVIEWWISTSALAGMSKTSGQRCEKCGKDISALPKKSKYCGECAKKVHAQQTREYYERKANGRLQIVRSETSERELCRLAKDEREPRYAGGDVL